MIKGCLRISIPALLWVLFLTPHLLAGPVPGVEDEELEPVEFPTPPSVDAWVAGPDEFLVEFRWNPDHDVATAGVAGSFNEWSRTANSMTDPDGDGVYTGRVTLSPGEYQYKFISNQDGWYHDPLNPEEEPDNFGSVNSILRLGATAREAGEQAPAIARGDGFLVEAGWFHDPSQYLYFDPTYGDAIALRVRAVHNDVERVRLVVSKSGGEFDTRPAILVGGDEQFDYYEAKIPASLAEEGDIVYHFAAHEGPIVYPTEPYSLTPPEKSFQTPDWAKKSVWYQILIDRFRNGDPANDPEPVHPWTSKWYEQQPSEKARGGTFWEYDVFSRRYGGDIAGVIEKLDYLKDLGVTAIYFNPVFAAPGSHKYNAYTFVHISDDFGVQGELEKSLAQEDLLDSATWTFSDSDQLFLSLLEQAHQRGIRIIIDGVFNHMGDQSPYFLDVKAKGKDSRFADWFEIESWEPFRYEGWKGFGELVEFRHTEDDFVSDSLRQYIFDITARWMDPNGDGDPSDGVDGWRLDVPHEVPLPFWADWRDHVKSLNPQAFIVAEIWGEADEFLDGEHFDGVTNYPFAYNSFDYFADVEDRISTDQFDRRMGLNRARYPWSASAVSLNLLDSHDTDRWISRIMNPDLPYDARNQMQKNSDYVEAPPEQEDLRIMKLMALWQATYLGPPLIWQGTEIGMYGADDPNSRRPMWWRDLMPYENPDYVPNQELFDYFQTILNLRLRHDLLMTGEFRTVLDDNKHHLYGFLRYSRDSNDRILVLLNNSKEDQTALARLPEDLHDPAATEWRILFGNGGDDGSIEGRRFQIEVPALSGTVILFD